MYCTECGNNVPDGADFCTNCGTRLEGGAVSSAAHGAASVAVVPPSGGGQETQTEKTQLQQTELQQAGAQVQDSPLTLQEQARVFQSQPVTQVSQPGQEKPWLIPVIVGATVVLVLIIILVAMLMGRCSSDSATVTNTQVSVQESGSSAAAGSNAPASSVSRSVAMPDLSGMSEDAAVRQLKDLGFADVDVQRVSGKKDAVISQTPTAGKDQLLDSTPTIYVGNGDSERRTVTRNILPRTSKKLEEVNIRVDPEGHVIPDLLSREYTRAEIEAMDLTDAELYVARNEIVALTGYRFSDEYNFEYFSRYPWYKPTHSNDDFTGIPAHNADVIRDIERSRNSRFNKS